VRPSAVLGWEKEIEKKKAGGWWGWTLKTAEGGIKTIEEERIEDNSEKGEQLQRTRRRKQNHPGKPVKTQNAIKGLGEGGSNNTKKGRDGDQRPIKLKERTGKKRSICKRARKAARKNNPDEYIKRGECSLGRTEIISPGEPKEKNGREKGEKLS